MKPLNNILIKPSGPDCNLNCTYCFYLEKADFFNQTKVHRMSDHVLEEMIRQLMQQSGPEVSMTWQGGEPTLMGLDFYKKAVAFQQQYGNGKTVGNGFQTNGVLINEAWADFLAQYQFLVGLSLDGPRHIHDKYRRDNGGNGTWKKVDKAAKLLLSKGVATNAMVCLNDYSVNYPEEIYNYHKNLGLSFMQFIPIVETDKNDPTKAAPFSITAEQYGEFLCRMFDLWQKDFQQGMPTTSVRHFESVFHRYVGLPAPECTMMRECGVYLVVEHDGSCYCCDFFVEEDKYLGNITQGQTLLAMLNSGRQHRFGQAKADLNDTCKACPWLPYCYGGCPKDRIKDPRDNNHCRWCKSYLMFFEHADARMKQLAAQWKAANQ